MRRELPKEIQKSKGLDHHPSERPLEKDEENTAEKA